MTEAIIIHSDIGTVLDSEVGRCREKVDKPGTSLKICGERADYILWGTDNHPDSLGPRCSEHARYQGKRIDDRQMGYLDIHHLNIRLEAEFRRQYLAAERY